MCRVVVVVVPLSVHVPPLVLLVHQREPFQWLCIGFRACLLLMGSRSGIFVCVFLLFPTFLLLFWWFLSRWVMGAALVSICVHPRVYKLLRIPLSLCACLFHGTPLVSASHSGCFCGKAVLSSEGEALFLDKPLNRDSRCLVWVMCLASFVEMYNLSFIRYAKYDPMGYSFSSSHIIVIFYHFCTQLLVLMHDWYMYLVMLSSKTCG